MKKFAAGLTLLLLISPIVASAATMDELQLEAKMLLMQVTAAQSAGQTGEIPALQGKLQGILGQIATLQSSTPTQIQTQTQAYTPVQVTNTVSQQADDYGNGVASTGMYCPNLRTTFQKGARDSTTSGQVSELQAFLTDYFNLDEKTVIGGYFGNLTQKYVVQFQSQQGLPSLGIVGSLTRASIAKACGGSTATTSNTPPTTVENDRASMVDIAQQLKYNGSLKCTYTLYGGTLYIGLGMMYGETNNTLSVVRDQKIYSWTRGTTQGTIKPFSSTDYLSNTDKVWICAGWTVVPSMFELPKTVVFSDTPSISATSFTASAYTFIPSVISGSAPLAVTFKIPNSEGSYVDFGDGSQKVICTDKAGESCSVTGMSHTYMAPGTYVAKLYQGAYRCQNANSCGYVETDRVLSFASIAVLGSTNATGGIMVKAGQQPGNTLAPQGAVVAFTTFTITNNGTSPANITGLTIQRTGSGDDGAFHHVVISNEVGSTAGQLIPFNASHQVSAILPDNPVIAPGQTKTFTISGAMQKDLSAYANQLPTLSLVSVQASVPVSGTFPITGAINTTSNTLNVCYPPQTSLYGYKCWDSGTSPSTTPVDTQTTQTTSSNTTGSCASPPTYTGPIAHIGQAYTFTPGVTLTGAPDPMLPYGLTVSGNSITGTPTGTGAVSVRFASNNSCGAIRINLTITEPKQTYQAPTCTVSTNKSSYVLGESVVITWSTTNATTIYWLPDVSGKDNLAVPATGAQSSSGSVTINASVLGNPFVTLLASGAGGSIKCQKIIPVNSATSAQTSSQVKNTAQLAATLTALEAALSALIASLGN